MFFLIFSLVCNGLFGHDCHTDKGTEYGEKNITSYVESNHGPDGNLFLDPYFKSDIENLKDEKILDAGCGAAPWAIYAAKHGGEVYAIDIQEGMIQAAKKAIESAKSSRISLLKGDIARLPYRSNFFDKIISICVGCNLPLESFEKHFSEFERTLKADGVAVIGAPTSLDVVFSNGSKTDAEVFLHIQEILNQLPDNPSLDLISEKLAQLEEVLSATFHIKNNRLVLVANEKHMQKGEKIWRKLPKLVVPNCYYSREHYIESLEKFNFIIDRIDLPHFRDEETRLIYNNNAPLDSKLGQAYLLHAPFVIFHIKKGKSSSLSKKSEIKRSTNSDF